MENHTIRNYTPKIWHRYYSSFSIGPRAIELTHIMLIEKRYINVAVKRMVNCDYYLIWDFSELLTFTAFSVVCCDMVAI
jgi:hypothetical protein